MKKTMFTEKIEFKEKVKELRYECDFYKGNIIKSYKTMFDEKEMNRLVYDLTVTEENLKNIKNRCDKGLRNTKKIMKWGTIGFCIYCTLKGGLLFVPIIVVIATIIWAISFNGAEESNNLANGMYGVDDSEIFTGKHLNSRDKEGVYSDLVLEFLDKERLIYEYTYYKVVVSSNNGITTYSWKKTQEVSLVFLDKLEKIRYFPEGIEVEGKGYFHRFDGSKYYCLPKIFIPKYIVNYDEIIEEFEKIAKKYNVEYGLEK